MQPYVLFISILYVVVMVDISMTCLVMLNIVGYDERRMALALECTT